LILNTGTLNILDENLQNIDRLLENINLDFLDHILDSEDTKKLSVEEKKLLEEITKNNDDKENIQNSTES
jgi:hypothetical protein